MDQQKEEEEGGIPLCWLCGNGYHGPRAFHGDKEYSKLYMRQYTAIKRAYKRGPYKPRKEQVA